MTGGDWYAIQAMQCLRGLSTRGFSDEHMARIFRAYAAGAPRPAASRVRAVGE